LNRQLSTAREAQRKSEQLYEQSEAEKLTLISLKNGEIAKLKRETETYKGKAALRLIIIIFLVGAVATYIIFKMLCFLRVIPS
jgi:hypothetical protein